MTAQRLEARQDSPSRTTDSRGPIALWLCALDVEWTAAVAALDVLEPTEEAIAGVELHERIRMRRGVIGNKTVVVALIGRYNANVAHQIGRVLNTHPARAVFFVGLAGGVSASVRLGDVVISRKTLAYEIGKVQNNAVTKLMPAIAIEVGQLIGPSFDPSTLFVSKNVEYRFDTDGQGLQIPIDLMADSDSWFPSCCGEGLHDAPRVHQGTVASGEKVLKTVDAPEVRFLANHATEVLAIETEGVGFGVAAQTQQRITAVSWVNVRGISDTLSDKTRLNDSTWQPIAARHAAAFAAGTVRAW